VTFATTYTAQGFAPTIAALGGAAPCTVATVAAACLIDDVLSTTAKKSGYSFTAIGVGALPMVTYTSTALPTIIGQSGQRAFCSDQSGVIRQNAGGAACLNTDPAL
jgi:type IV pilus assembly protein PilA